MYTKLALIALLALTGASAKSTKLETYQLTSKATTPEEWIAELRGGDKIDWYSCKGKRDGDYDHPYKCDHFISCVAGTEAYERPCANMDDQGNKLHYVPGSGPDKETSRCDWPQNVQCTATPTPTAQPPTEPTPEPPTEPTPKPDECDPDNCQLKGNCTTYFHCEGGRWAEKECGTDLFWNPNTEKSGPLHGGTCDYWDNLDEATKAAYLADEECIPKCAWFQAPGQECSPNYSYREPFNGKLSGRVTNLECPEGLIWLGEPKLTCGHCSDREDRQCCETQA